MDEKKIMIRNINYNDINELWLALEDLKKDSHPPVNWKELIQANQQRIEEIEKEINILVKEFEREKRELWSVIESLAGELKEEKKDNEILGKMLRCHLPQLGGEND